MQQALTNALLMDAVVGSLQSSKAIYAASKLAYFDRMSLEGEITLSPSPATVFAFVLLLLHFLIFFAKPSAHRSFIT